MSASGQLRRTNGSMAKYSDHTSADMNAAVLSAFIVRWSSQRAATWEALSAQKHMLQMNANAANWDAPLRSPRPWRRLYVAASAAPPSTESTVSTTISGNTDGVPGGAGDAEA